MRNQLGLVLAAMVGVLVMGGKVWGQVTVFTNPITDTNPNTANPYSTNQVLSANLTSTGIGRGSGITGANATNRYNASSWDTVAFDPTAYFTWNVTPAAGYAIDVSSLIYTGQVSNTSINAFAFRSSADGFTANIGAPTATGSTISLSSTSHQNLTSLSEFRLYAWGAGANGNTFSVNDFNYTGLVSNRWSGATSNSLSDGGNFVSLVAPQPQNGIQFEGSTNTNVAVDSAALSVQGIRFASGASAFTLSGSNTLTIDVGGGIANYSSNVQTINANLAFNASQTINTSTANINIGGVVSSAGVFGVTKAGANTLTLSGNNTYTGATTVSAGTLLANGQTGTNSGTGTGAVTVSGGTLGGTGRIGGATTVAAGGAIRGDSGNGTGTLTLGSNLTITGAASNGGRIQSTVSGPAATVANSKLNIGGNTLTLAPSGNKFLIDLKQGNLAVTGFELYTITLATKSAGGVFKLGTTTLVANDVIAQSNYTLTNDFQYGVYGDYILRIDNTGNNLQLTFTPVPEPGTLLALGAAGLGLLGAYRRYRTPAASVETVA